MAISSSAYHSSSIVGQMQVGANVNILKVDSNPQFPIGQGFTRADGNKYRYAHFGASVAAGKLVSQDVSESTCPDLDNSITSPAAAFQVAGENSGIYPGAVGSRYVVINTSATITAAADTFAGAYLITTDDAGEGFTYRIKGNTAKDDPVTNYCRLELFEPIVVAMSSATDASIVGNLYANVEMATDGTDEYVCGVSCSSAGADTFGWVCTAGVIGCAQSATVTIGQPIVLSTADGQYCGLVDPVVTATAYTEPILGYVLDAGDATGHGVIKLILE